MSITKAEFTGSFPNYRLCPNEERPEFAFIGRSNVGKSSLINMLTNHKGLALVSGKPGKTQSLNYFIINREWYLVDLPGYGYARISKKQRQDWRLMVETFLIERFQVQCNFLLIDANVPAQKADIEFMDWLGKMRIPFVIVYTKVDRLRGERKKTAIPDLQKAFLEYWEELPQQFITSANKKEGRDEILAFIEEVKTAYFERQKLTEED